MLRTRQQNEEMDLAKWEVDGGMMVESDCFRFFLLDETFPFLRALTIMGGY